MTAREKLQYLQYTFIQFLRELDGNTKPAFGKMNVHQMVEHMTSSVDIASGKVEVPVINEGETAERSYKWMMSEAPFKDNTTNQLLPDTPAAVTTASIGDAIDNLEDAIADFVAAYTPDKNRKISNSFFGELDYYEQVQLLYKHAQHHQRQFNS